MLETDFVSVVALTMGLFVALAMVIRHDQMRILPGSRLLVASYGALLLGLLLRWGGAVSPADQSLALEHLCYAVSTALAAWWVWRCPPWKASDS